MNDAILTRDLFIDLNGRIVCARHGGSYLQSTLEKNPEVQEFFTPITHWVRLPYGDVAHDPTLNCEDC